MTSTIDAQQLGSVERVLLKVDEGAFGALCRVIVGFATLPSMSLLMGSDRPDWALIPYLLLILLLLRIVPTIVRNLVQFPAVLREAWATRRRTAKRYDSYQWRKLLWIGVGLAVYMAVLDEPSAVPVMVCAVCLLAGAAGMARWHAVSSDAAPARAPMAKTESAA
jgi:DMSO reductase anchor subunit